MTMSNQCKWISFGVMSLTVILFLLLFYSIATKSRCPEENQLRYEKDGQCYEKNKSGPCSHGFVFSQYEPGSHMGGCSCPYMLTNRTIVYHNGQCYYIFSQAYCPVGHWLNVTAKGEPKCETNRCMQPEQNGFETKENANDDSEVDMKSRDQYDQNGHNMNGHREEIQRMEVEWMPIKGGGCARLGEHSPGCPEGSVVRFHSNYILPSCHEPPTRHKKFGQSMGAIGVGAYMTCPLGSAKAITGFCQPLFEFDFEEPKPRSEDQKS